jgi:hypothetical protein
MEQKPPQRATYKDVGGLEKSSGDNKKSKLSSSGLMNYIVMVVIAVAVCIVMSNFVGITPKVYNKNNTSLDGEINSINALIKTMQTSISGMPATVSAAVKTATDSLNTQISTFTSSVDTLQSEEKSDGTNIANDEATIATLKTNLTAMQTSIDSLKTAMGTVNNSALQASLTTLQGTVTAMQTELNTDEATIKSQGTMIANLQAVTTTTTSTTTTPVANSVSVSVVNPTITLTPASGFLNAFNLTIVNGTSKNLYGGQISFTIQLIGLASTDTLSSALAGTPLNNSYIAWLAPTLTPPITVTCVGNFSGYVSANSSTILNITVKITSLSPNNVIMTVSSPTITGYTTY